MPSANKDRPIIEVTPGSIYLDTPRVPVVHVGQKITQAPLPGARAPYDVRSTGSGMQSGEAEAIDHDKQPSSPAGSAAPDTIPPTVGRNSQGTDPYGRPTQQPYASVTNDGHGPAKSDA